MSWIAEYDTQGREFPTCVHVTKTTGTMTHGATYVPIEDGKAVRAENAKLRELAKGLSWCSEERYLGHQESECPLYDERTDGKCRAEALMKELGIEVHQ